MVLDYEEDFLLEKLKKIKPKKVLVQLPEGIKRAAFDIQEKIEKLGINVVYSGETAWGGCCVSIEEAKSLNCDLIVHFGHAPFMKVDFPIIYVEMKDHISFEKILKQSLPILNEYRRLGFSYSIQHKEDAQRILDFYESNQKEIIMTEKKGRAAYSGHIIGCEYSGLKSVENKVDAFLILGNRFHSIGAALAVNKPVFLIDVYNSEISNMNEIKEKLIKQRFISIEKLKKAKNIGIIIEERVGQIFGDEKILEEHLKSSGKKFILISIKEITPEKIDNFSNIDAFICLACPRISIDDYSKYSKPILTFREAMVSLGKKSWEDLLKEGFV